MTAPGSHWRTLSWTDKPGDEPEAIEHSSADEPSIFDELVIDDWFHLEQMTRRRWWMRIGDLVVWVKVAKDGRVHVVSYDDDDTASGGKT
jgi:hypothetical protein